MNRQIDKMPPTYSGDVKGDMQKVMDYLVYLRERINFMAENLEKQSKQDSQR